MNHLLTVESSLYTSSELDNLTKMDLDISDLIISSLSASLWITEQSLYLFVTMLTFVWSCVHETLYFTLSWLPTAVEFGLSWFLFILKHLSTGGSATFWVCIELALSGWEKLAQLFVVAVNIGWEGIYALFSLMYVGGRLLFSTTYQFGEVLLKFVRNSLQAITWRENMRIVGSKLHGSLTVSTFSKAVMLCKAFFTNLFYITVGLIIVTCTYFVIKLILDKLFKKKVTTRQRRHDDGEVINEPNTLHRRSINTLRQRIAHRDNSPDSTGGGNSRLQGGVSNSSGNADDTGRVSQDKTDRTAEHLLRQQLSKLNSELSQEKDKTLCVVCLDNKRELLLKPCNHYCLCTDCVPALHKCPVCTRGIQSTEKIFHV